MTDLERIKVLEEMAQEIDRRIADGAKAGKRLGRDIARVSALRYAIHVCSERRVSRLAERSES